MAERIVSPGVFTQERDLSFLPQGIASIGAAFIGPTTKGPAFMPTAVEGIDGFVTTFGEPSVNSYMTYAVQNYLQEAGSATIVRVLGLGGYSTKVGVVYASGSAGRKVFAVLHANSGSSISNISIGNANDSSSFSLVVSASNNVNVSASSLSTREADSNFISDFFGSNPIVSNKYPAYVYAVFPTALSQIGTPIAASSSLLLAETMSLDFTAAVDKQYKNGSTPWIRSQPIAGTKYDLFKVHTLGDGIAANTEIKISITGITPSTEDDTNYGTFSLLVRKFDDTDTQLNVLEQYDNLTLDPNSPNYIARRIGNSVPTFDSNTNEAYYSGDYANLSKYIRIEMREEVIPETALPYGFAAISAIIDSAELASGSYVTSRWMSGSVAGYTSKAVDKRYFYGYDFSTTTTLSHLNSTIGNNTVGEEFNIAESVKTTEVRGSAISLTNLQHVGYRKFTVPFQSGFDGYNPARIIATAGSIKESNTQGFNLSDSDASGSVEFKRALDTLSNPDNIDLNLLLLPGVIYSLHTNVAQYAIDLCEQRGDCFYIMDLVPLSATISDAVNAASLIDTNYAAAYYPWIKVADTSTNKLVWAPPSVVLPEVYAFNDSVGAEWFAPAGLNRGGIPGAVGVKTRLNQAGRDDLYEGRVNPIAQFPGQGICVWGQKTLQRRPSALDRVNVRRLLITLKKFIASSARYLVFEQNTEATRNRFLNIVNPYLSGIQQRSGLTAFRVVMDDTNNTPDIIDRNILVGSIYLQPTRTAEFIKLDFNILPTGATFDTI